MKRLYPTLILAIAAVTAAPAQTGPFIAITRPTDGDHVQAPREPVILEGTCSKDIVSVTVEYYWRELDYDKSSDQDLSLVDSYTLKKFVPGSGSFLYRIFPSLGNLGLGTNLYKVIGKTASGLSVISSVQIYSSEHVGERAKPVIYLYPERAERVFVNVQPREGVSVSDPPLGTGWNVDAHPDGRIVNVADGKTYPYLFWESPDAAAPFSFKEGFVVERAGLEAFFRIALAKLGLIDREIADFLEFWLPLLNDYEWYHLAFWPKDRLDAEAPLTVIPAPDTVIRVYFDHRGLDGPISVPAQRLDTAERRGFTVVEWGGRKYR